jgi:nucleolar protein 58
LKAFYKFTDTTEALAAASAIVESKMSKTMKKFLKKHIIKQELTDELAVADSKLGGVIKDKLDISCIADTRVNELMRGIRSQMTNLIEGLDDARLRQMQLGLGHTLSRYKLKFSPDKVDTMIVQAIGLLDDLDKEVNTYAMRVKEWYGWHFPEMTKIVLDNMQYAKVIGKMGLRIHAATTDFSDILAPEIEEALKESAILSMGTDISPEDLSNISELAGEVVSLMEYRATLADYLANRMNTIAPNLTTMVGELVGARLISHAGSLMNLAKQPASTVQILGAEKALFRALKTKHDTPKYGLIYHASLIGQAAPKNKGKISRVLAAKTALSIRVDALGDTSEPTIALEARAKVEQRLRQLEGGGGSGGGSSSAASASAKARKFDGAGVASAVSATSSAAHGSFNTASDFVGIGGGGGGGKKRKAAEAELDAQAEPAVAMEEPMDEEDEAAMKAARKAAKKARKAAAAAAAADE